MDAALSSAQAAAAGIRVAGAQLQALRATAEASARQQRRIERLQGEGGATASVLDAVSTKVQQLGEQLDALQAQRNAARGQAAAARAQAEAARNQAEAALSAVAAARADVERTRTLVEECRLRSPVSGLVQTRAREPGEVVLPGTRILTVVDEVIRNFFVRQPLLWVPASARQRP